MPHQSHRHAGPGGSHDHAPAPAREPVANSWGNGFFANQLATRLQGEDGTGSFGESLVDMLWRSQGSGTPPGTKAEYQSRDGWAGGLGMGFGGGWWGSAGGLSHGGGLGLGLGGNQWSRQLKDQNTGDVVRTDQGVGFGAGAMAHRQFGGSLWGYGGSASTDLYGGVGGNALQFRQGDRTGVGLNGQVSYGVNNVALNANTPLGSSSTQVENANLRMRAASVEGYRTDAGGYGVQGTYSGGPKVSVSNVEHHQQGPLGTTDVSLGSYSSGLSFSNGLPKRISRGGVEVGPDGSVKATAGATSGGLRAENLSVQHDFGGGNRIGGGFGSVDTNNSWDVTAGWNHTARQVEASGKASTNWAVEGAHLEADGPGGYRGEASAGRVTGGGWQADGSLTAGADGVRARGNASWGGYDAENVHLKSGWDGVYETTVDVGTFGNSDNVEGGRLDIDGDGLRAGFDKAGWGGFNINDARLRNELFGVTSEASVGSVVTDHVMEGGSLELDSNGLRAGLERGEFGGVSVDDVGFRSDLGGHGSAEAHLGHVDNRTVSLQGARLNLDESGLHAGVEQLGIGGWNVRDAGWNVQGPGGMHSEASLGDLSTGFNGQGLSLDATSEGLRLGADQLDYATVQGNNLHLSGGIPGFAESSLDLGHGHYHKAGAENVNFGVSKDGTVSLSADNAHYSYLGLEDLHARQSYFGGQLGTQVDLGEGNLLGVSAGHLQSSRNGDRASASVEDLRAHGLQLSDVNLAANVGDLGANLGADRLNLLDLSVGHAESNTSLFGARGTGSVSNANLDLVNAENFGGGLSWGGQQLASARTDLRLNAGVGQANGAWDLTRGTASGSFTDARLGLMTDHTRLGIGDWGVDIGRTGVNLNATGAGNVDLFNGRASGNVNFAGSELALFGQSFTAPEWAQASGAVDLGQGAFSGNIGGENGLGADVNLSEGNFDINAFGTKIDVDEGLRSAGEAISDVGSAIGDTASKAWDFATSW